jgi:hypothetical protein
MIEHAMAYLQKGFSIIPCGKDKKPLLEWKEFQHRKATPEEVQGWYEKNPDANIGIVTGAISGICVIDIDSEIGRENVMPYLLQDDAYITPTANTPRGGSHFYFKCNDMEIGNNAGLIPGSDFRANGGFVIAPPSCNAQGKLYEWVNDLETPLKELPGDYLKRISVPVKKVYESVNLFQSGRRDEDLFHIANVMAKGRGNPNEIKQVLTILAQNCNPPYPANEINAKVLSAMSRTEKSDIKVIDEVRNYCMQTEGQFTSSAVYDALNARDNKFKATIRQALKTLKSEGVLTKSGDKDGNYRRIDTSAENIDFINAVVNPIDIKYPFGIENLVHTLPKNIIVVAGVSNAGKTAFLLNIVAKNMYKHNIHYFSSEMGPIELKMRLQHFAGIPLDKWRFFPKERVSDFDEVIQPNDINIIDFLEMTSEFWRVSEFMQKIYARLDQGIAIVAIQKNPNCETGLGGYRGFEKPRLYLNMDMGKLKIMKAKNWVQEETNPNNLAINFKLVQGCQFKKECEWYKDVIK